jgi:hypothetical protein
VCEQVLKPGGLVVVKDNCSDSVAFVLDKDDSSVTRYPTLFDHLV